VKLWGENWHVFRGRRKETSLLEIDLAHLGLFDDALLHLLKTEPNETLALFEVAAREALGLSILVGGGDSEDEQTSLFDTLPLVQVLLQSGETPKARFEQARGDSRYHHQRLEGQTKGKLTVSLTVLSPPKQRQPRLPSPASSARRPSKSSWTPPLEEGPPPRGVGMRSAILARPREGRTSSSTSPTGPPLLTSKTSSSKRLPRWFLGKCPGPCSAVPPTTWWTW
jgi:hypothetical protein